MTLKWKILLPIAVFYVLAFSFLTYFFIHRLEVELNKKSEMEARVFSQSISSAAEIFIDENQIQRFVSGLSAFNNVKYAEVVSVEDMRIIGSKHLARMGQKWTRVEGLPIDVQDLYSVSKSEKELFRRIDGDVIFLSNLLTHTPQSLRYTSAVFILVLNENAIFSGQFNILLTPFVIQILIAVLLGLVIWLLLKRFIEKPIEKIVYILGERARGDSSARIREDFDSEMDQIRIAMNSTFDAIDTANATIADQQQRITQTAKMSALGEMSAGIAHEINNPLTIISGKAVVLRKKIEKQEFDAEFFLSEVGVIEKTALRIAKIIKGLQTFSRSSTGDLPQLVLMSSIVEDSIVLGMERIRSRGVDVTVDTIPDVKVSCQPVQIVQVVLNLLNNAFDAIDGLDQQWIRLSFLESRVDGKHFVTLRVIDSGRGISDEVAAKMMQPFFTTKEVGRGTGLGLSLSKGIVESHGGTFRYVLSDGHTCFEVSLPVA